MKVLGLDLGTNSIGWALIDNENQHIIDLGVRIFPEGINELGKGDKEESKMAARRQARGMRRQYDRRRRRKIKLKNWLKRNVYWPAQSEYDSFMALDPYKLRAKGLEEGLSAKELSRVLYHLNQHRGFKSNGTSGEETAATLFKGNKETGVKGILESEQEMKDAQTLGQYLHEVKEKGEERVRSRYTLRRWYEDEFDHLMDCQKQLGGLNLSEDSVKEVKEIIYFQRPLKDQSDLVGNCKFEPEEKRVAKAHPQAEEFVIWQTINNLEVHPEETLKGKRRLSDDERELLFGVMMDRSDLKTADIAKRIKLQGKDGHQWTTNFKSQKTIKGSAFRHHLKKVSKKQYDDLEEEQIIQLFEAIDSQGPEEFIKWAEEHFELDKNTAVDLHSYQGPKGYLDLSLKAIRKLLPHMRNGLRYSDAMDKVGYQHNLYDAEDKQGEAGHLPLDWLYEETEDEEGKIKREPKIKNPIVFAGLWEMRKLVNELIDRHEKPDRIHIEMAREVKGTKAQRYKWSKKRDDNYSRNQEAREELKKELGLAYPTRGQLLRYNLWNEQGGKCIYSGKNIEVSEILNDSRVQVDHILPYSRFKQDGYMNKVICLAKENADKSNKTPMEWLGENSQKFNTIMANASELPEPKQAKLTHRSKKDEDQKKQGGFDDRKLVDTSYIMRKSLEYLSFVLPKKHIWGVKGQYTHQLRSNWFANKNKVINSEMAKR